MIIVLDPYHNEKQARLFIVYYVHFRKRIYVNKLMPLNVYVSLCSLIVKLIPGIMS